MTIDPGPPIIPPTPTTPTYSLGALMPQSPQKRRVHPLSIVLAAVGGLSLLCGGVLAIGSVGSKVASTTVSPSPVRVVVTVTVPVPAVAASAAVPPAPVVATAPPPPAAPPNPTIDDGTWTVGSDIPAGKYRTAAAVAADCYWAIFKSGTNSQTIIANDIPGGGRPTVTLKVGQDFNTAGCGTWDKIG